MNNEEIKNFLKSEGGKAIMRELLEEIYGDEALLREFFYKEIFK